MKIFKNKWSIITILTGLLLLSIPILYKFFNFIIFYYPIWVKCHLTGINQNGGNIGIGTYGDMYGGLNAFVSGLAFLALLVTIGIQIWLHYRQEESKKEEKLKIASNKLVYLNLLVTQSLSEIDAFKTGIGELIENNSSIEKNANSPHGIDSFEHNKINNIVNKIDQEIFFTAYYQKHNKTDLISLFELFNELLKSWQSFIRKMEKQNNDYNVEISNLKNAFIYLNHKESEAFSYLQQNPSFTPLGFWSSMKSEALVDIEMQGNTIEIYDKIKEEYKRHVISDYRLKAPEIDTYIENCDGYIKKIKSINQEILSLCSIQITEIANYVDDINKVKIL